MISREDLRWGAATALAALLCLAALPLLPVVWLAGRIDDRIGSEGPARGPSPCYGLQLPQGS